MASSTAYTNDVTTMNHYLPPLECDVDLGNPGATHSTLSEVAQLLRVPFRDQAESDYVFQRRRIKSGHALFIAGQSFEAVFLVRSGFFKTFMVDETGNEQVLSFPMKADLLGLDGIYSDHYVSQTVALCDCEVITIPFEILADLGNKSPELKYAIYRFMSRELGREHAVMTLLGTLGAEARVARFLVMLSERFAALGFSPNRFNLRMTRQEIGSYLGLTLETVSRAFSSLHAAGLIKVEQKSVEIMSLDKLRTIERLPGPAAARSTKHVSAKNGAILIASQVTRSRENLAAPLIKSVKIPLRAM